MKQKMIVTILVVGAAYFLYLAFLLIFPNIQADNAFEQTIEGIIEKQTGLDIDFTPTPTPECYN